MMRPLYLLKQTGPKLSPLPDWRIIQPTKPLIQKSFHNEQDGH
ncbi:MAG: hypothetical protein ACI9W6_002395 [Motiliproteus sp.]|jgi:hypothetical protein